MTLVVLVLWCGSSDYSTIIPMNGITHSEFLELHCRDMPIAAYVCVGTFDIVGC